MVNDYFDQIVRLRQVLSEGYGNQYLNDMSFHTSIDTLAAMLPAMIAGLAAQCAKEDNALQESLTQLLQQSSPVDLWGTLGVK